MSPNNNNIIEVKDLDVFYGAIQALRKVSLSIKRGEIVSLIGANGAGKSTLLNSIFKIPTIVGGSIHYNGDDITALKTHQISRLGISLVPEGRHIFPRMTVLENLLLGCTPLGFQHKDEDLKRIFALFAVLKERKDQAAGTLSGGEQQMLAVGRALMSRPKLLLLDEPSLGLAPLIIRDIFKTLVSIAKEDTTIFLVEQNARMALKISTRGYLLVNGKIEIEDSAKNLINNPEVVEGYMGK
ncbi:MAG: ABC transporter ATP-binding protein [SAR324 cluster bacterium]|nr:ABC transporter ATP-binding protein [SAR324 cluster bacterium]